MNSCLYIDIENIYINLIMKLMFIITNYKANVIFNKHINLPVFIYKNNSHSIFLND